MAQRGRKKGVKGVHSRALLLLIAASEFAQHGYHETKISTIVTKAGVTQPTFYLYFQNKESVFQELVDCFQTKLLELTRKSRLEPGLKAAHIDERIHAGLSALFHFFNENRDLTSIGLIFSPQSVDMKEQLAHLLHENLTVEQKAGYFKEDVDMKIVAESLVGIIERLTMVNLFQGRKSPDELAAEVVQLLLYGMRGSL